MLRGGHPLPCPWMKVELEILSSGSVSLVGVDV